MKVGKENESASRISHTHPCPSLVHSPAHTHIDLQTAHTYFKRGQIPNGWCRTQPRNTRTRSGQRRSEAGHRHSFQEPKPAGRQMLKTLQRNVSPSVNQGKCQAFSAFQDPSSNQPAVRFFCRAAQQWNSLFLHLIIQGDFKAQATSFFFLQLGCLGYAGSLSLTMVHSKSYVPTDLGGSSWLTELSGSA